MQRYLFRFSTVCLLCALPACAQFGIFKPSKPQTKPTPDNPLAGSTSKQPDKELFEKAMQAMKKGKYDVARLDLQTLLNTYPESEYQMRAKLAVGDSWFKEGGTAALTQAEAEYKDFITFFPNQPEAAEAQMKVADIYYMQMEKPDRDPKNAEQAEQEYRTMIQQFPDSPFVPRAKQRLREVQEVLAEREYQVGSFYASHENWAATIARLQTVTDSYPLYSRSDLALIGLGDAYAAEARYVQGISDKRLNPKAKQELMKAYDDQAADAYSRVVTHYPMAPHVEDARERLIALNRPVPEPTKQELADSEAEEQSRTGITFKDRVLVLVKRGPVTVNAARVGDPTITDPPPVTAPEVHKRDQALFAAALTDKPLPPLNGPSATPATAVAAGGAPSSTPETGEPLQLEGVPSAGTGAPASGAPAIGASIVSTGQENGNQAPAAGSQAPPSSNPPAGTPVGPPVTPEGAAAAAAAAGVPGAQNPGGLNTVAPTNTQPLPPIEKPADAPAQTNDVPHAAQVQTGTDAGATATNGKKKKTPAPKYDSSVESSSKHKKKKGLDKLNPF
ncbi:MAG TPA: outer membrane protein assembly factor BamD [Acidobacteriaceae bacterium]|nr:outer membrane protein assembly factor BamD [Acidobacteriaceae bacterium]